MSKGQVNVKLYLCAFFLPVFIAVIICIGNGVYPFGEECILHIDMYHQYEPFFTELMDKLKNGNSLLYSFRIGLGSDFVSLFAYYLASPFNWLLLLCPSAHVIEFMTILILLKMGLCGLTFAIYLKNHFETKDFGIVLFSAFYALSGYMAAYSWNIMWLDCLVLAPLVILGLEKLVKEGESRLYCITLAVSIFSNFYIAIMLCIFLVLYYVILFFEEVHGVKDKLLSFGRFALYSLLAGGMGAVLILPEIAILGYSGSSGTSFPKTVEWYFDLVSMLARHCMDVEVYTGTEHWPNLYCGAAVFLFLVLYLCNRNISRKKKVKRILLIVFFWISFANNILDFIWHGMHFPQSLPGRQVFLYVFLLLVMAYEAYHNREGNTRIHIGIGLVLSVAFLVVCGYVADTGNVPADALIITGVLTLGYGMFLLLWRLGNEDVKYFARLCLILLAITELYVNFSITGFSTTSRSSYTQNWESVKGLLAEVDEQDTDAFYRVEEMERLTKNDAAIYGYPSSTIFSSLMNIEVSRFYRLLGMEGGKNFYSYSGATPLASALLSVKYLISDSPYEESPLRTLVATDEKNYIYQNMHSLPLGFMVDYELEENWKPKSGIPFSNLNGLAEELGAETSLFTSANTTVEVGEKKTLVTVYEDCYLYGTYSDTSVKNITITNGSRSRKFTKCDHGYILDLGWCKAGDVVEITNTSDVSELQVQTYQLDLEVLDAVYQKLNSQTLELDSFDDTQIEGHIDVKKAGNLVISIPNESGWHVFVDGEEVEAQTFMESFIEIPLPTGEHRITLKYMTPGLKAGAAISLASLAVFILLCVKNIKDRSKHLLQRP